MGLSPELHVTRWWSNQPPVEGFWGPATASIDWCEANYAITRFIAEFTNTISNLIFVSWAIYGIKNCRDQNLPLPFVLCQVGIALVGIGSFLFHATLRYEWQLGDELPMIFAGAMSAYVTFDTGSPNLPRSRFVRCLPSLLIIYSFGVTAIYLWYPNPVFHQTAFAAISLITTSRSVYISLSAPERTYREKKNKSDGIRYSLGGTIMFIIGFLIWNIDNLYCDRISQLKEYLGTPWSFIIEGHAWWHLATGTGTYLNAVGTQLMSLSLKEGSEGFEIKRGGIFGLCPYVARISSRIDSKLQ
ncbi:hypothetical protein MJO28_006829 [Puccinia striiformis f. sp. tritici]|uniref:Alkaline phytoceramidase n=2 Tax=Puccinia striiformis f. sp. tritici TaxID=168172 RepID=A0A0L0USI0_9BASI|nr:hypothetical protein Pst134EB_012962 [Puccinia striiformis f. sp. tritici]KAI7954282.1 hypothetical protein MJO28_006829 [Puccinia striiformis f. sp. tritici]KNE90022.1 hypothetical protein PSTG_16538 [Puccinia striiformis f. sp. tritici PST-78]